MWKHSETVLVIKPVRNAHTVTKGAGSPMSVVANCCLTLRNQQPEIMMRGRNEEPGRKKVLSRCLRDIAACERLGNSGQRWSLRGQKVPGCGAAWWDACCCLCLGGFQVRADSWLSALHACSGFTPPPIPSNQKPTRTLLQNLCYIVGA